MRPLLLVVLPLLAAPLLASPVRAAPLRQEATSTAEVTTDGGATRWHLVNRTWRAVTLLQDDGSPRSLLLGVTTDVTTRSDLDGSERAETTVQAFDPTHADADPLWTVATRAETALAFGSFGLDLVQYGCCAARDLHAVYSLQTARFLYYVNDDHDSAALARLQVSGGGRRAGRTAALFTGNTGDDRPAFGGRADAAAVVTWADPDQPLQRVMLVRAAGQPRPAEWGDAALAWEVPAAALQVPLAAPRDATLRLNHPTHPAADVDGFSLVVTLDGGERVVFPVRADRLDLARATLPPGISAVELRP